MSENTAEKKEASKGEEIDEILDNIKETMNQNESANEEVLELTEKVDSGEEKNEKEAPAEKLDKILGDSENKKNESVPKEKKWKWYNRKDWWN